MSVDFEERLRSEMAAVEVRPRPGLVREAYRRHHRRRVTRAAAAAGVAAAAAAGIAIAVGGTSPGEVKAQNAAYVVQRVRSALAATDTVTYTSTRSTTEPGGYLRDTMWWAYGTRARQLIEVNGHPVTDVRNSISHGEDVAIQVIYPLRRWSTSTFPAVAAPAGAGLCQAGQSPAGLPLADSALNWKNLIQSGLRCGVFTVDGRQRVDGIDAIRLTGHFPAVSATLWIDPRTYLPVEMVTYQGMSRQENFTEVLTEFRWLQPTRANLALLSPPIPAGFRRVSG